MTDQPAFVHSTGLLDRQALHAAAAGRLRDLIVEGVLPPGARLNERVLAAELGVSRTPLREAFKVLAGEGLVALLPNRGAMVVELSRADIEHTFELMAALEALSGELAARRVTDAEIDEARALHYEMLAAHARRDLPAYYRLNLAIHRLINGAARNPVLAETYRNVNARIQSLRFKSNLNRDKWDAAVREHAEMIDALAARDGTRLGAVLRRHLENKRDVVLAQLSPAGPTLRATSTPGPAAALSTATAAAAAVAAGADSGADSDSGAGAGAGAGVGAGARVGAGAAPGAAPVVSTDSLEASTR